MTRSQPRFSTRITVLLFALPFLALGLVLAIATIRTTVQALSRLDAVVIEHGPPTRASACGIVLLTPQAERKLLGVDPRGCDVLQIGDRVTKEAWSLAYRTQRGGTWQAPAGQFWLGCVLASLCMGAWLFFLVYVVVADRRRQRSQQVA